MLFLLAPRPSARNSVAVQVMYEACTEDRARASPKQHPDGTSHFSVPILVVAVQF